MYNSPYILNVIENGETYPYPYSKLDKALEHFNFEQTSCELLKYINGQYKVLKTK
jgi:hypothetical protein